MTLRVLPEGATATVIRLSGEKAFIERMNGFGLHPGSRVRLVKAGPFRGPLLVEDLLSGARFLIDRGMADKIEVRDEATRC